MQDATRGKQNHEMLLREDGIGTSTAQSAASEHDAVLKNLALVKEIADANMFQQNLMNQQQVLFNLSMVTTAKLMECIVAVDPADPGGVGQIEASLNLVAALRLDASQKEQDTIESGSRQNCSGPAETQPKTSPFSERSA